MSGGIKAKRLRNRSPRSVLCGADRAVAATVTVAVAFVLVLIGFSGTSVELRLPGAAGWVYIGFVAALAGVVIGRLLRLGGIDRSRRSEPNKQQ
jgi:hypothetical protein